MNNHDEIIFIVSSPISEVPGPITLYRGIWERHIIVSHPEVSPYLHAVEATVEIPGRVYESKSQPGSYLFVSDSVATSRSGTPLTVVVGTAGSEFIVRTALFHRDPAAGRLIYMGSSVQSGGNDDQG